MNRVVKIILAACGLIVTLLLASNKSNAESQWKIAGSVNWLVDSDGALWLVPVEGTRGVLEINDKSWERAPWYSKRKKIRAVRIPEGKVISLPADSTHLFHGCVNLEDFDDLQRCDVSRVVDMNYLFCECEKMINTDPLSGWNMSNVNGTANMFLNCISLTDFRGISKWNFANVIATSYMFCNCVSLEDISPIAKWNTYHMADACYMFSGCVKIFDFSSLSKWNTISLTIASGMFQLCPTLSNLDFMKSWFAGNLEFLDYMFYQCENLSDISGISDWTTYKVQTTNNMFSGCTKLSNLDALATWDMSALVDAEFMFYHCEALSDVDGISLWNLQSLKRADWMFVGCKSLKSISFENWDTSNVESMLQLFKDCDGLTDVILGEHFYFHNFVLPEIIRSNTTGKWIKADLSAGPYTGEELARVYSSDLAGVWILECCEEEPIPEETSVEEEESDPFSSDVILQFGVQNAKRCILYFMKFCYVLLKGV